MERRPSIDHIGLARRPNLHRVCPPYRTVAAAGNMKAADEIIGALGQDYLYQKNSLRRFTRSEKYFGKNASDTYVASTGLP